MLMPDRVTTTLPPLRVAHGVQSLDVGGLERVVLDLVRRGRAGGAEVSVVCVERPGTLAAQVEAVGGRVISLNKPPGRTPELTARARPILAELRPTVLHTHTSGALLYLGPAAPAGVPVLHTEHGDAVGRGVGWWAKLKARGVWHQAAKSADLFCGVSADIVRSAGRWGTVPKGKLDVVLNGIDTERYATESRTAARQWLGLSPDARVIGTVGRLNEVKRQDLLLRGVAQLGGEFADVRVVLVGDGPERPALERLATELGLNERVTFAGYQSAPEQFLPAFDLFALTSRNEGLPLALLEAWASGVPVVASAVGGVPKAVAHERTGLLFPSGDVRALADALRQLLSDPAAAVRMGEAGRAEVRASYSLARMAAEYDTRYRQLIRARGGVA